MANLLGRLGRATNAEAIQPRFLDELQVLRFIAAALVLCGHVLMETRNLGISAAPQEGFPTRLPWGAGVDIFFFVSGFIIFYIIKDTGDSLRDALDFLVKRIIRIAPLYWMYTALMLAAILMVRSSVEHSAIDARHIVASLFFIAWPRPDDGSLRPLLGQGWTLNYEMFFYLIAAMSMLVAKAFRIYFITALIVLIVAVVGPYLLAGHATLQFYANSLMFEFLAGVWLCRLRDSLPPLNRSICWALIGFGFLALVIFALPAFDDYARPLRRGIPALMIAAGFVLRRGDGVRRSAVMSIFSGLGDASYSLYLSHPFVINGIALIWVATVKTHPVVFASIVIVASLAASRLSYVLIERPVLRYLRASWDSVGVLARGFPAPGRCAP